VGCPGRQAITDWTRLALSRNGWLDDTYCQGAIASVFPLAPRQPSRSAPLQKPGENWPPGGGLALAHRDTGAGRLPRLCRWATVSWAVVAEPRIGAFKGLDAGEAVELGELLAFFSDWLASDPKRLDGSLYEFVGVPDRVGPPCRVDELRAEVERFARLLLGYDWANGE
jgi:hypothetical protein